MASDETSADAERRVMETILGPNPVMPTGPRLAMVDIMKDAMEKVLINNGII